MSKRKYTKRSDYWEKFNTHKGQPLSDMFEANANQQANQYEPQLVGEPFYTYESKAYSRTSVNGNEVASRRNNAAIGPKIFPYANIRNGMSPYNYGIDGVNVRDAIELCQKAYCNIAIFRNSVDMMSDFANSTLYLEGGSARSRTFINAWLKKIKIWNLKDQFFREYYRSGNVFLYTIDGKFNLEDFTKLRNIGLIGQVNKLPIRYILLNPFDMAAKRSTSFENGLYEKILSEYELERLQNPKTDEDKELYKALTPEMQKKIDQGGYYTDGMKVGLDPTKLRYSFYKKQDYEPFAVPFGFGVLDDINFKMEMKKIDQSICRTIENVVLLITMGTTPDKGGVNPRNITAMQTLFQNQSVGRVLVSDYTTSAEFIIPDLKKVIGPEKYEVVNQDIKEGLQNIILNQEKFASTEIKAQMFLQRLNEAREAFLNDFLQAEIKKLCKDFGFRDVPQAKFETIDLKDSAQVQRVITRMMELGILPPEEGIKVIETGVFPKETELRKSQERFIEDRKKGFYNPIVGGVPLYEGEEEIVKTETPNTPKLPGRPNGAKSFAKEKYSVDGIKSIVDQTNKLYAFMTSEARSSFKKKRLNKDQKEILARICESIIVSTEQNEWEQRAKACLHDNSLMLKLDTMKEVSEISANHLLDDYAAAILYHSNKNSKLQ
jgi:hypothetical protein